MIKSIKYLALFIFFLYACGENTPDVEKNPSEEVIDSIPKEIPKTEAHKVFPVDEAKLDESLVKARENSLECRRVPVKPIVRNRRALSCGILLAASIICLKFQEVAAHKAERHHQKENWDNY